MGTGIGSFAAAILLGFVAVVRSCGTDVVGLIQDPGFTYESAVSERMAIGGVVYSIGPEDIRDAVGAEATNQLRITFMQKRKDLHVFPVGTVRAAVGNDTHARILEDYEHGAALEDEDLDTLRTGLVGTVRYVVLSRIEEDYVYTSRRFYTLGDEEKLELKTHRRVTASFRVYDLDGKRTAWRGILQETVSNPYEFSRELSGEAEDEGVWTDVVLGVVINDPTVDLRYPDPPNLQQVLPHLFAGFVSHLPREEMETAEEAGSGLLSRFKSGS
jgi:hypothetical protein